MQSGLRWKPARRLALVFALSLFAGACDDDPVEPEVEPEIQSVRVTVGASSITINKTTGTPSGELSVPLGTSTVVVAWLKADGSNETIVTSDEFEAVIEAVSGSNLTFSPSGAFGGSLTVSGIASGAAVSATVALLHIEEQHEDFGPYTFTIRVQ
jgi:hypothetical protein